MSILQYLFLLVFSGKSMYMDYLMGKTEAQFAKDTVYRFMKSIHINWLKSTTTVASRVANEVMVPSTAKDRVNAFIIDDSVFSRCRSKSVELLAKIYDHAEHKYLYTVYMYPLATGHLCIVRFFDNSTLLHNLKFLLAIPSPTTTLRR